MSQESSHFVGRAIRQSIAKALETLLQLLYKRTILLLIGMVWRRLRQLGMLIW
jgi:hypothetical protein